MASEKRPAEPLPPSTLLRRDIVRLGLRQRALGDLYHFILNTTWTRLFLLIGASYILLNMIFGVLYLFAGDGVENARTGNFEDAFFFSVQTMATIGYGKMVPKSLFANILVTTEALFGLLGVSMGTGLMFAKFARPNARALWSNVAVIGRRDGEPCLMIRVANERNNGIVEATMRMVLLRSDVTAEGETLRRMYDLELGRASTTVFALTWTVFHPIRPSSPLYGKSKEWLGETNAEIICSLTGLDETFGQTIHARHSYMANDVIWGARLVDVFSINESGKRVIDYTRFHAHEPLAPFAAAPEPIAAAPAQSPTTEGA